MFIFLGSASWVCCLLAQETTWHVCSAGGRHVMMTLSSLRYWRNWSEPAPRCWIGTNTCSIKTTNLEYLPKYHRHSLCSVMNTYILMSFFYSALGSKVKFRWCHSYCCVSQGSTIGHALRMGGMLYSLSHVYHKDTSQSWAHTGSVGQIGFSSMCIMLPCDAA